MLPKETIDMMFAFHERYNIQKIGIEEVGFQDMLIHEFKGQRLERDLFPLVVPLKSGGKRKALRIEALQPYFESGKVLMKEGMDKLRLELLRFPSTSRDSHDDLIDSLAYMPHIARKANKPAEVKDPNTFEVILETRRARIKGEEEESWFESPDYNVPYF